MKIYNKLTGLLLGILLLFPSCKDWDFDVDESASKLFRTPKIETTEVEATRVLLQWNKVPKADYYIVEISQDSLLFSTELESLGTDGMVVENKLEITSLLGATRYSVRIKSISKEGVPESEFATITFKTKSEQILNEVSAISGKSATITWMPGLKVSHVSLKGGVFSEEDRIVLTADEIAKGEKVFTGLTASTDYGAAIWLNDVKRGSRSFTTTENFPDGYTVTTLAAGSDFLTTLQSLSGNVVLVFPTTVDVVMSESFTMPEGITSIYFWGATGSMQKAKFSPKSVTSTTALDFLAFYNLELYNAGPGGDYIVNQNISAKINQLSIDNCILRDTRGIIRIQGDGGSSEIGSININNCIFTNIGSYGIYSGKGMSNVKLGTIDITKSTFNGVNSSAIINTQQSNLAISINECTFYNSVITGKSFVDVNKDETILTTIKNTIIGKIYEYATGNTIKACSLKDKITVENVFSTSDCPYNSGYEMGGITYEKTSSDLFEDPDNGNFKIKDASFTGIAGDPRWRE